jgi:hypothetical protein
LDAKPDPENRRDDLSGRQEITGQFIRAGDDASPIFERAEDVFGI